MGAYDACTNLRAEKQEVEEQRDQAVEDLEDMRQKWGKAVTDKRKYYDKWQECQQR